MRKCDICGKSVGRIYSNNCKFKINLCDKHYFQMRKHGKILDKTRLDKNNIVIYDDYAEIILCNHQGEELYRTKVSLCDIETLRGTKWAAKPDTDNHVYVTGKYNDKRVIMHRLIMDVSDDLVVDHISHDTLDNRRSNLRVCTLSENNMNRKYQSNNTSGTIGVSFSSERGKWVAYIKVNGKMKNLGRYNTKEEAITVRQRAVKEYFGNFAYKESV